jgi:hypothetical protein
VLRGGWRHVLGWRIAGPATKDTKIRGPRFTIAGAGRDIRDDGAMTLTGQEESHNVLDDPTLRSPEAKFQLYSF